MLPADILITTFVLRGLTKQNGAADMLSAAPPIL